MVNVSSIVGIVDYFAMRLVDVSSIKMANQNNKLQSAEIDYCQECVYCNPHLTFSKTASLSKLWPNDYRVRLMVYDHLWGFFGWEAFSFGQYELVWLLSWLESVLAWLRLLVSSRLADK